jgi:hypothetical protein
LEAFSILAIRAIILLKARSSSRGRSTARVLLLFLLAETKAAGEEATTRSSSKGTAKPMIGNLALVEAISVVGLFVETAVVVVALLLAVVVAILLPPPLDWSCRYARTLALACLSSSRLALTSSARAPNLDKMVRRSAIKYGANPRRVEALCALVGCWREESDELN